MCDPEGASGVKKYLGVNGDGFRLPEIVEADPGRRNTPGGTIAESSCPCRSIWGLVDPYCSGRVGIPVAQVILVIALQSCAVAVVLELLSSLLE